MDASQNHKYITRIDHDGSNVLGWQVRFNRKGSYLSKLFSDNIYGGKEQALEAAFCFRNQVLIQKGEGVETTEARIQVVLSSLPSNNTSGILGVSRSLSSEKNGGKFPLWQTTYKEPDGHIKSKSFRVNKLGELRALTCAVEARLEGVMNLFVNESRIDVINGYIKVIDEYEKIISYLKSISEEDSQTLIEFLSSNEIGPTSKKEMLERRLVQHIFRSRVMEQWSYCCAVTGASAFCIASHIKPWAVSNDEERVNPYNGISLSPNYDKAFDAGYISFNENGSIILAKDFSGQAILLGIKADAVVSGYTPLHDAFMKYHRTSIFRKSGI